jgi:hypothetical protein
MGSLRGEIAASGVLRRSFYGRLLASLSFQVLRGTKVAVILPEVRGFSFVTVLPEVAKLALDAASLFPQEGLTRSAAAYTSSPLGLFCEHANQLHLGRPKELIDRHHSLQHVATIYQQPCIASERSHVARNVRNRAHRRLR